LLRWQTGLYELKMAGFIRGDDKHGIS